LKNRHNEAAKANNTTQTSSFPEIKRGGAQLKQAPPSCCLLKGKDYITEHHSNFRAER